MEVLTMSDSFFDFNNNGELDAFERASEYQYLHDAELDTEFDSDNDFDDSQFEYSDL